MSFRAASAASGLSVGTWQRAEAGDGVAYASVVAIAETLGWHHPEAADRLLDGSDPEGADPDGGAASASSDEPVGLAALAGELSPEGRAKVEGYIRALLDQEG